MSRFAFAFELTAGDACVDGLANGVAVAFGVTLAPGEGEAFRPGVTLALGDASTDGETEGDAMGEGIRVGSAVGSRVGGGAVSGVTGVAP